MPEPIVAAVVVDGVERWGAVDAPWMQEAQAKAADQAKAKPKEVASVDDGADDAAPGDDQKPRPTKR